LNIALPIRPRIGQVEALVDYWKIRNDIAFYRFHDGWPVVDGWIFHLAAFEAVTVASSDPVNDLATPPFHRAQRAAIRRNGLSGGAVRTVWQMGSRSADHLYRLPHFINANLQAVADISRLVDWHAEREVTVRLIRVIAPKIEIDAGGATCHADDSQH
jgi:hypothetical protein